MGNKSGRHRRVVDEKYTRPQGLYPDLDVDHKRLKKLILDSKLAPCYPGADESSFDLEECLICYLYYPSLNRSRCCKKSICTECFLKLKSPHSTRPTECPFCKNWNYAVEYRGKRSEEEKGMERLEEQRVIEAQMRIQREELQDEEERMRGRQNNSPLNRNMDLSSSSVAAPSSRSPLRWDGIVSSQNPVSTPIISQPSRSRRDRENGFDLDLEDIMVMEAIWLSVQENEVDISLAHVNAAPPERFLAQYQSATPAVIAGSSSSSFSHYSPLTPATASLNAHHRQPISFDEQMKLAMDESGSESSWEAGGQWGVMTHRNELAEARTSYTISNASTEFRATAGTTISDGIGGHQTQMHMNGSVLSESFEEQIALAKAISLAEACSRTDIHGVTWL